jgi:hypothetical protein
LGFAIALPNLRVFLVSGLLSINQVNNYQLSILNSQLT